MMKRDPASVFREGTELSPEEVPHDEILQAVMDEQRRSSPRVAPKRQSRAIFVTGGFALAAAATVAVFWLVSDRPASDPVAVSPAPVPNVSVVELAQGVEATLHGKVSLSVIDREPMRVAVKQSVGRVRYRVTPGTQEAFDVVVQGVGIRVLGTVFDVTAEECSVNVNVERGRVQVTHLGGESILSAGQSEDFIGLPECEPKSEEPDEPSAVRSKRPKRNKTQDRAAEEQAQPLPSTEELLQASDLARERGQTREAVSNLQRLVELYPNHSDTALALLTLGRIEAGQGRHQAAATHFAEVRAKVRSGPLAEDALAEEAWSRRQAGQTSQAADLARKYLDSYPAGTHRERMTSLTH